MSSPSPLRTLGHAFRVQARIIGALILRDMRTRFGRTYFSYVIQVGWPLSHLLLMMSIYVLARRFVPMGTDLAVFSATGLLPYILCLYPTRFIMMGPVQNLPLLSFPIIKTPDLIISRAILEIITAFAVFLLFTLIISCFDINIIPPDPATAMLAIFATIYFAFCIGFFSAVMYGISPLFMPVLILSLVGCYAASNLVLLPSAVSPATRYLLSFNPMFQCIEWLRSAYYQDFDPGLVSPIYLVGLSTYFLFSGLIWERMTRGKMLS